MSAPTIAELVSSIEILQDVGVPDVQIEWYVRACYENQMTLSITCKLHNSHRCECVEVRPPLEHLFESHGLSELMELLMKQSNVTVSNEIGNER